MTRSHNKEINFQFMNTSTHEFVRISSNELTSNARWCPGRNLRVGEAPVLECVT